MISIYTAPVRLRTAILEYLFAVLALRILNTQPGALIPMPEFTAADLLRLHAQIRRDDLYAGCFLLPRRKLFSYLSAAAQPLCD